MMNLLQSLQEATVVSTRSLTDALRLAKILASRLKHLPLKEWVDLELDGYPPDAEVPSYREIPISLRGQFIGPWGSGANNAHIPHRCIVRALGESAAARWRTTSIRKGIAECEHMVSSDGELRLQVSPDVIAVIGGQVYENMNCVDAFAWLSPSIFHGIVDSVRNRLLTFVLELEATHGVTIQDGNWSAVPVQSITQIFNHSIFRDVAAGANIVQR